MDNLSDVQVDKIKAEWKLYRSNAWIGVHKETGKKVRAGTYYSLLSLCESSAEMSRLYPSIYR
jgi:hypothetical protein